MDNLIDKRLRLPVKVYGVIYVVVVIEVSLLDSFFKNEEAVISE